MDPLFKADLNEYICQCKIRLQTILHTLDWTEDATIKDYNTNSIAASSKADFKKSGSKLKASFPDSCVTKNSILLKTPKIQSILANNELKAPENFQELQANFSREQKLQIYEHVIANTEKVESNYLDKEVKGEISLADILAQKKREEKRKKRRFRKSKPTHIEEVRWLVDIQMQALEQFMGNKRKTEGKVTEQNWCTEHVDRGKNFHHREEICFENNDRKKRHREFHSEYEEIKSRHKTPRIESACHESGSVMESSCIRRELKSCERDRRRSRSASTNGRQERKKHRSTSRHKSKKEKSKHRRRSRSPKRDGFKEKKYHRSERRSRSRDKDTSQDRKKSKRIMEDDTSYHKKYSSRSEFNEHSRKKYNTEKYYRNDCTSSEHNRKKHRS